MKKQLLTGTVLSLLMMGVLLTGCGGDKPSAPAAINFAADYNAALAEAGESNKNMVIDFYTDWCGWCKRLDTVTFVDSAVIAWSENLVFVQINAEVDTITAQKYSVNGFPHILIANSDGTEIDRIVGYLPPAEFITEVNNYLNGIGTLDYFLGIADTLKTTDIFMRIADKYSGKADNEKAEEYYNKVVDLKPADTIMSHAKMQLANIYRRTDRFDDALAAYKSIQKEFKGTETEADAEIWTAIVYRDMGDTVKAIKGFEEFVKNHPDSRDTSYALGQIDKLKNPPAPEEEGK